MVGFWHVAWDGWVPVDSLRCRDALTNEGVAVPWSWPDADEGFDGGVVCLFPDDEHGRQEAEWLWYERPSYWLLHVELPDDWPLVEVEEGYPAVEEEIPAEFITAVAQGYREGVLV